MAKDYDTPRASSVEETQVDSLEELQIKRHSGNTATIDVEIDVEGFELPGAGDTLDIVLSEDEFTMPVIPMQVTEFRCSSCFLVHPIHRRAYNRNNQPVCNDCA